MKSHYIALLNIALTVSVLGYPKNSVSQQVLSKEQRTKTVVIENLKVQRDGVSGELRNRSSHRVRDVELLIRHVWLWNNEFRPGAKDPGMAVYHTLDKEIQPGGSVPFTHKFAAPLPERADGVFETVVSVGGFAEIIPQ